MIKVCVIVLFGDVKMVYLPILYSALFFLQLSFGSTHSLAKLQGNNNVDVYEVLEDKQSNSISFINPKAQKPTLREIVYYHIVERPYLNDANPEATVEDTERPFTNGHGLQFDNDDEVGGASSQLINDTDVGTSSKDNNLQLVEDKSEDKSSTDESAKNEQESSTELNDEEVESLEVSKAANNKQIKEVDELVSENFDGPAARANSDSVNPENGTESPKRVEESASETGTDNLKIEDTLKYGNDTNIGNEEVPKDDVSDFTKEHIEPTSEKTLLTRNKLFDSIKTKYGKFVNANRTGSTLQRRKRHAEEMFIPEAPILPGMNFQPAAFVKRSSIDTDPADEAKREIRNKMEKMFDDVANNMKKKHEDEPTAAVEPAKPRTYGMNLAEDHGFVWNNIFTKPGVAFSVGNQDTKDKNSNATPTDPSVSETNDKVDKEPSTEEDKEATPNNEDLEDIEVNINKKKEKPEDDSNEKREDGRGDGSDEKINDDKNKDDKDKAITPLGKSLHHNEDEIETDLSKEHKTDEKNKKEHDDTETDHDELKSIKENKIDGLNSLMANKQFWEWLGDWTSVYMEMFVQNVGSVIKEEIKKQTETTATASVSEPHLDKTEQELRKRHHKKDNKAPKVDKTKDTKANTTNSKIPVNVTSDKMYGNAVGNEKVTNIFIFYPNEKSDKIIEDLKPLLNPPSKKPEDKDTLVINKDTSVETNQEKDKPIKLKPEQTKPIEKESKDKESEKLDTIQKDDKTKETTDKVETTDKSTEQVESTTKGDTIEAIEATTVENKSKETDASLDKSDVTTENAKDSEKSKDTSETTDLKKE